MKYEQAKFEEIGYVIRYPRNYEAGRRYPVILHLHGSGSRSGDLDKLEGNVAFELTEKLADFPFVLVAPHCSVNTWFDVFEQLKRFTRMIASADYTDPRRLYLTGTSMGAYGAWQLAMSLPELFAALVPICGGGMYWNAARLVNVPVWAFHGGRDKTVLPSESEKMVEAVNKKGGSAKLTIYPENAHNAWSDTFSNPEVFAWLLSHTNENAKQLTDTFTDGRIYG